MNTSNFEWPVDKKPLYSLLSIRLRGLIDGIPHQISNLANASALLGDALLNINWVGFYLMREGRLVLGPFQGKPACIEIEVGKGVCGTAVANDQVMLVKDVHQFPGHIACDSASNSEIVIPLHKGNEIVGVLDIDSPVLARTSSTELYPSRTPTIASILTSLTQNSLIVIQPPYLSVFLLLPVLFCILPGLHWKSRSHGKQYQYPPAFLYL